MDGLIEFCGPASVVQGVVIGGWIDLLWTERQNAQDIQIITEDNTVIASALIYTYRRDDLKKVGSGFIVIIENVDIDYKAISAISITAPHKLYNIRLVDNPELCLENEVLERVRYAISLMPNGVNRDYVQAMLVSRPSYAGVDTFPQLKWPFDLRFDDIYYCPPDGLLFKGWMVDPFEKLQALHIICAGRAYTLDHRRWLTSERPDVAAGFARRFELSSTKCGFLAFVPAPYRPGEEIYVRATLVDGAVAYCPISPSLRAGIETIKAVLSGVEFDRGSLDSAFKNVLGPALARMNAHRLSLSNPIRVLRFGDRPKAPRCSIIIPLYGRMDFMEYQLAFFRAPIFIDDEIIYVLDDPKRRAEAERIAASCHEKFQIPFTLLILDHNVGFSPANNIGVRYAEGEFVCLMNSDVFPMSDDWLDRLIETLSDEPKVAVSGPVLIYEDGTLQHRGCVLEPLPEYDEWLFPMHPGKGFRPDHAERRTDVEILTGACMVLKRNVFVEFGGFDEGYIIGDFEDAQLCSKLKDAGLRCVVDEHVVMYHLERQSQAIGASSWRHNLTLYNAWRFNEYIKKQAYSTNM